MKLSKIGLWLLSMLFMASLPLWSQVSAPTIVLVASAPSGSCTSNLPDQQVITTGVLYSCQSGTWEILGGGGGGGPYLPLAGGTMTGTIANHAITSGTMDGTTIGGTTPAAVTSSALTVTGSPGSVSLPAGSVAKTAVAGQAGSGAGLTTGPTSSTNGDLASFTGTGGQVADSSIAASSVATISAWAAWTPTDASGAGLTFTSSGSPICNYNSATHEEHCIANITWPSGGSCSADTHEITIGGLPVTSKSGTTSVTAVASQAYLSYSPVAFINGASTTATIQGSYGFGPITNMQLCGGNNLYFDVKYPTN